LQTDGDAKSVSLERKYIKLLEKRIATLEALVEAENKAKVGEQNELFRCIQSDEVIGERTKGSCLWRGE